MTAIDQRLRFEGTESGFVEVVITEHAGDRDRGCFRCTVERVLSDDERPLHLPATLYGTEDYNGLLVITPKIPSPTGYILPANLKAALLRRSGVYAVIVNLGNEGWHPSSH